MKIESVYVLKIKDIEPLIKTSEQEGFRFLSRLKEDWIKGINLFNKRNEQLYQVRIEGQIVAIGGINNNPYEEKGKTGRIRHVYILPEYRRKGIGRTLILHLLKMMQGKYERITLRTDTKDASIFYESLGFEKVKSRHSSHEYIF